MDQTPNRLRAYGASLAFLAVAAGVALAVVQGLPSGWAVALFGSVAVYSELKDVETESVVISPGWMIGMAAIVAFDADGRMLGPLLIGLLTAIHVRHFQERAWSLLALNAGVLGLANLSAAVVFGALPAHARNDMPTALVAPIIATVAYIAVLWTLLGVGYMIRDGYTARGVVHEVAPLTAQFLAFSIVGYLLGRLYVDLGPAVMLLIVVPILIAREMFASYLKVKEAHDETVRMLVRALEQKDRYTSGHSERVARYALYMGEAMNFGPARMERLRFAALMHDIGKLVVPNHLLNKPGRLTEEEFTRIRIHEKVSVQMLSHIDFLRPIAAATHSDHMRFDPDDPDHPIEPYIVMIADAYDAMTSTRSYRRALCQDVAFRELRDKAGIQFHPACVEALIRAIENRGEKHGAGYEVQDEFDDAPEVGVGSAGLGDLAPSEA